MPNDAPTIPPGLAALLEAVPNHLAETALVVIAALATAYNQFNARRTTGREGRRKSDPDTAALVRSAAAMEHRLEELTGRIDLLAGNVRSLEDRVSERRV